MKKVGMLLLVLLFLLGCVKEYDESEQARTLLSKDPDLAGAVLAVREYNRNIVQAYQKNDPAPVRELTGDGEFNKLGHMIEGMQAQRLRLESTLQGLQVEKIERWGANNALVTTVEKWRYRRVNSETGAVVKPYTEIEYHMYYDMIRPKGKWVLLRLTPA